MGRPLGCAARDMPRFRLQAPFDRVFNHGFYVCRFETGRKFE